MQGSKILPISVPGVRRCVAVSLCHRRYRQMTDFDVAFLPYPSGHLADSNADQATWQYEKHLQPESVCESLMQVLRGDGATLWLALRKDFEEICGLQPPA